VAGPSSIEFRTRWGVLNLAPGQVRQIILSEKNQAAHRLVLSDGSSLSGILTGQSLTLQPIDAPQPLEAPVGEMARIVLAADHAALRSGPKLEMVGGDVLRGTLQGTLTLQTLYGPAPLAAEQIIKIALSPESAGDVTVTLADGRVLRGAEDEAAATCAMECGVSVQIPANMIAAYDRAAPPAEDPVESGNTTQIIDPAVVQRVQPMVKQLESQQLPGPQRQRLQNQIVAIGKPAVGALNQIRPAEPPRVQRQIDIMIARIQAANQDEQ
jgi:hypothetical protein